MSPPKRSGYSSYTRRPSFKTTKRIVMPSIPKRPIRFQARSLIRKEELDKQPWWLVVHRRGIRQPKVGIDPLEARAVPHDVQPGYLTERILYAALVNLFHFVPGIDFTMQTAIEGGRIEMGGLVADFLFPFLKIVLNPLGPQHYQFRNMKKDEEQIQILAEMGYQVFMFDEEVVYDEYKLEEYLRRIFGGMTSGGGDSGGYDSSASSEVESNQLNYDDLHRDIELFKDELYDYFA